MSEQTQSEIAALYQAARDEAPTIAAREKTQRALLQALSARTAASVGTAQPPASRAAIHRGVSSKAAWAAIPLLAAAVGWLVLRADSMGGVELSPEIVARDAPSASASLSATRVETPPERGRPAATAIATQSAPLIPPRQNPVSLPPTLRQEIEILDEARAFLSGGDAVAALQKLDDYDRKLRGVRMNDEAILLRISALSRVGRYAESRAFALRFIEQNPNSPLVERAQQLLSELDDAVAGKSATGGKP